MKFDVFKWQEVALNSDFPVPDGRCDIRASSPVTLYAISEGYEAIAGHGTVISVTLSGPAFARVEAHAKGVRAFVYSPPERALAASGTKFTSLDRAPQESGTIAEIKRTLRLHQIEQAALHQRYRAELARDRADLRSRRVERSPEPEPEEAPADTLLDETDEQ